LYALTQKLAKPAVPFGGKYRIIDFPLSNCVNSGIDTIGILTQYQPVVLNEYIGHGQPWDLDRLYGGVHVLPPYQKASGSDWFKGTANTAGYSNYHIPFASVSGHFEISLEGTTGKFR
jgi:glucose-1-phosphate adenylyltransferase